MQRPQIHPEDKKASSGSTERGFLVDTSSWAKSDSPQSSAERRHPALCEGDEEGVVCVVSHPTLWDGFSLPDPVMSMAMEASTRFPFWGVLLRFTACCGKLIVARHVKVLTGVRRMRQTKPC